MDCTGRSIGGGTLHGGLTGAHEDAREALLPTSLKVTSVVHTQSTRSKFEFRWQASMYLFLRRCWRGESNPRSGGSLAIGCDGTTVEKCLSL